MTVVVQRQGVRYRLVSDGSKIGEAWKMQGRKGFGFRVDGVYWRKDAPNRRGGSTSAYSAKLGDIPTLVEAAFKILS